MIKKELHEKIAESLQEDSHRFVDQLKKQLGERGKSLSHQDGINVWLYRKLAEYELRIQNLELKTKNQQ